MALQFASRQPQNAAETQAEDRPQPQVYLNVGYTAQIPNPETGEVEDVFISAIGIALDTAKPLEVKGSNKNWANMVQAKNWVLDQLQKMGEGVEAGDEEIVNGLQVQIKRVGKPQAPSAGDNPFLTAIQGNGALQVVK